MPATHGTAPPGALRLYVNIDHVATIREARRTDEPDPVLAAHAAVAAGAHGITAHLREDRRHVQDRDVERLRAELEVPFNLEMACTPEMIALAERLRPYQVTFVPERREEVTTEGGLDLVRGGAALAAACARLAAAGVRASLFVAPGPDIAERSAAIGAPAIELHTGAYAHAPGDQGRLRALAATAREGRDGGLAVHAGHGLTVRNVGPVAALADIEELNIGHSIVSMSVFTGIGDAVRAMLDAMRVGRALTGGRARG
jgi:pyridoxine 5-phosphate synthase